MDLCLQFGHGMMEHCRELTGRWGSGTTILSPRDMTVDQLYTLGRDLTQQGGHTLLDPQFYVPRADHHGLVKHDYWQDDFNTSSFLSGPPLTRLLEQLRDLNDKANTSGFILPGLFCDRVDDDWVAVQDSIAAEAQRTASDRPRWATICLSAEALRFEDQIETVLNVAENWAVDGYYLVCEHPDGRYLVEDPLWLSNLMSLCAGMKLQGRQVIVGYSSHQMLCLACTGIDAIASGTWLNVRRFTTAKFMEPDSDDVSRRAKWYYCPQTLSEYKVPFLDMAFNGGTLGSLRPPAGCGSNYADILFLGAQPSTTEYSEQQSFRHYLACLHAQCNDARRASFADTCAYHHNVLNRAETTIRAAHRAGVRGQDRDFEMIIDVNRAAVDTLVNTRGAVLNRIW